VVKIVLPFAIESLNKRDRREHWGQRTKAKNRLALEVLAAIGGPRYLPAAPIERASVTIVRYSSRRLDLDNLYGGAKEIIDLLCVHSRSKPRGMGYIRDDDPDHLMLDMGQIIVPRAEARTEITIRDASIEQSTPRNASGDSAAL
jgi:hypothetical protein